MNPVWICICSSGSTTRKENGVNLSCHGNSIQRRSYGVDRSQDDMHHCPDDCLLIGTRLNDAKAAHAAFRTHEALAQHCRENGIDESASNHAKMCAVFRPIIKQMIPHWPKIKAVF